jgi:hypothetical protein
VVTKEATTAFLAKPLQKPVIVGETCGILSQLTCHEA